MVNFGRMVSRPFALVTLYFCLLALPAMAYIDPGTGSYIVQALIAGMLGILYFFKNIRLYLLSFFSRLFGKGNDENDAT